MSDAEQRRWDKAQQDESFRAWVEMNEAVLELELDEDIPGLPERPWGPDSLRLAEKTALDRFASRQDCFTPDSWDTSWRYVRFLGQTFIDAFEGTWVALPGEGKQPDEPAVDLPYAGAYFQPMRLLTAAMARRTGEEWANVYGYNAEDYAAWVDAGRPPRAAE